jgi:membrane protein YqaA with SNARE-associated domain
MEIRPRTSSDALILAIVGGLLGFFATVIAGYLARDPFAFYARGLVTASVLGAGVGWLLGTAAGLVLTRAAPPRTAAEAWALRAAAVLFVVAGLTTPWWIQVFPRTQGLGYHVTARTPMQWSIWLDAALGALTCLVLAQRRFRREAIVIGAVAGVGILVSAIVLVASGPCPLSQCDALLAGES